jgi:hypothetical protein
MHTRARRAISPLMDFLAAVEQKGEPLHHTSSMWLKVLWMFSADYKVLAKRA